MKRKYLKPKRESKMENDPFAIQTGRYKDGKIGPVYRHSWTEEVYMPEAGKGEVVGKNFNFLKLKFISFILFFLLLILFAKTAWLQIVKGEYYYSIAEGNRIRIERIEPKRGIIYDKDLNPLVRNKANFILYFVPIDLPAEKDKLDVIINNVSGILGNITNTEINSRLAEIKPYSLESYQPLFIADNIDYDKAMTLYLKSSVWPGVILSNKTKREYLLPSSSDNAADTAEENQASTLSLSHILGYTGKINKDELKEFGEEYLPIDYVGKMGIEYFWENELRGKSGKKQIEVDAIGKEKKILGQEDAIDGHNLVLSLDTRQQIELEKILRKHLAELKLTRAAAIIMNPNNGEILAMVSLPTYDNNLFAQGISQVDYNKLANDSDNPLFNRCISGEYPSGSTIKPILAAAALQEGIISERSTVLSTGGIKIGQWFFPDWLPGGHGRVNVKEAIAQSINTFFYYIGGGYEDFKGLGIDRIVNYGELFGLNAQTGIDLAGEASGFLPTAKWKEETKGELWYIGDTYHISIGQGDLLVTPLQVAVYTSVFANGGKLYRPHLVKEILSDEDQNIQEISTEPVRENFIDPHNIDVVKQGLCQTVTDGSARSLQSVPVAVAGKTGTAQWSSKYQPHAWFTGFAPYNNPEIVITILVEQAGEGSDVAVPIAREYLEWYFKDRINN